MRYHDEKPTIESNMYGRTDCCDHPLYWRCTLFEIGPKGLAVIQQRFDPKRKTTWWDAIDEGLADRLYLCPGFKAYFDERSGARDKGLYPTVSIRQIMWALRMKPLKRERWETVFDRRRV